MLKIAEYRNVLSEDGASIRREKIKLKELKEFGFDEVIVEHKVKYHLVKYVGICEIYNIKIDDNRVIHFNQLSVHNEIPNVIYDLIQAGLVEKV